MNLLGVNGMNKIAYTSEMIEHDELLKDWKENPLMTEMLHYNILDEAKDNGWIGYGETINYGETVFTKLYNSEKECADEDIEDFCKRDKYDSCKGLIEAIEKWGGQNE